MNTSQFKKKKKELSQSVTENCRLLFAGLQVFTVCEMLGNLKKSKI